MSALPASLSSRLAQRDGTLFSEYTNASLLPDEISLAMPAIASTGTLDDMKFVLEHYSRFSSCELVETAAKQLLKEDATLAVQKLEHIASFVRSHPRVKDMKRCGYHFYSSAIAHAYLLNSNFSSAVLSALARSDVLRQDLIAFVHDRIFQWPAKSLLSFLETLCQITTPAAFAHMVFWDKLSLLMTNIEDSRDKQDYTAISGVMCRVLMALSPVMPPDFLAKHAKGCTLFCTRLLPEDEASANAFVTHFSLAEHMVKGIIFGRILRGNVAAAVSLATAQSVRTRISAAKLISSLGYEKQAWDSLISDIGVGDVPANALYCSCLEGMIDPFLSVDVEMVNCLLAKTGIEPNNIPHLRRTALLRAAAVFGYHSVGRKLFVPGDGVLERTPETCTATYDNFVDAMKTSGAFTSMTRQTYSEFVTSIEISLCLFWAGLEKEVGMLYFGRCHVLGNHHARDVAASELARQWPEGAPPDAYFRNDAGKTMRCASIIGKAFGMSLADEDRLCTGSLAIPVTIPYDEI
jgi:hypothetical protein